MFGHPLIDLRILCGEPVDGRKDYIRVSDPDVQVRRMRHAEIVCEPLGDGVREKWKSGGSAEVG